MPPHLHPRSTATSTLFASTLIASFIVVGIPHVFPCPRARRGYADAERTVEKQLNSPLVGEDGEIEAGGRGKVTGKDTRTRSMSVAGGGVDVQKERGISEEDRALFQQLEEESKVLQREARECPVPKPRGWVGRMLGFDGQASEKASKHSRGPRLKGSEDAEEVGRGEK